MSTVESRISDVFDRLDDWRNFPAYQLERRADIFFSLYLAEVVEQEHGIKLFDVVVPEIPLKHPQNHLSAKADYLLVSADHSRAYLVELKTDMDSRCERQDRRLRDAAAAGMQSLLEGIKALVLRTEEHKKYYHLLRQLAALDLCGIRKLWRVEIRKLWRVAHPLRIGVSGRRWVVPETPPRDRRDDPQQDPQPV